MPEKDPFGDKLREKERGEEDQFFAKRERELLEKLRGQDESVRDATAPGIARGRCPKCGSRLTPNMFDDIVVETCSSCRGIWLDRDQVAAVSARESASWLARVFGHSIAHRR